MARNGTKRTHYPFPEKQPIPSSPNLPVSEPPRTEREIEFSRDGNRLRFTVDGETKWFEELGPLAESLAPDAPKDLAYLVRTANLSLLTSQVRLRCFGPSGAARISADCVPTKELPGLVAGRLYVETTVYIDFNADFEIDYEAFSDVPGLELDGLQALEGVSPQGVGTMAGSQLLDLSMGAKSRPFTSAEIDYSDVVLGAPAIASL